MIDVESRNNDRFNRSSKIKRVIHNEQVKRLVANYTENTIQPFTCTYIKEHLMMETGIELDKTNIRKVFVINWESTLRGAQLCSYDSIRNYQRFFSL